MDTGNDQSATAAARRVSKQLLAQGVAARAAELSAGTRSTADAAFQLQQKAVQGALQALGAGDTGSAASPPCQAPQQQQQQHQQRSSDTTRTPPDQGHTTSSSSSSPASRSSKLMASAPDDEEDAAKPRLPLENANTAAGPLVLSSVEESAEAAEALQMLDIYDFKLYGQGLAAGADAVPLTAPGHQVMYAPTPEETVTEYGQSPCQSQQAEAASSSATSSGTTPFSTSDGAALRGIRGTAGGLTVTSSGSPAIQMQPLMPLDGAAAAAAAGSGGPAAPATAAAIPTPSSASTRGISSSTTTTTAKATPLQQPRAEAPAGPTVPIPTPPPAAAAAGSPPPGSRKEHTLEQLIQQQRDNMSAHPPEVQQRHPKSQQQQQQQAQLRSLPSPAAAIAAATQSSSRGSAAATPRSFHYPSAGDNLSRRSNAGGAAAAAAAAGGGGITSRVKFRVQQYWQSLRKKTDALLVEAAEKLLDLLLLGLLWALKLLLVPLRAVLGPWYSFNRQLKTRSREVLAEPQLDIPELMQALGALPSWLAGIGGATERLDWANTLLAQVWPVLDPVACALIRSTVEPLLSDMKPPFIADMGFQRLTLGELPVKLEGLRVVGTQHQGTTGDERAAGAASRDAAAAADAADDRLELEVDFIWIGEPNISFFVEMALAGPYARLVPKVSNLSARGTLRIGLARLLPQLPGFGALLVSLARTPQVKFTLDFGPALGGKVTAKPVAAFLDPFIRDTLASMLVWPNRFVVPLLPREVTGNLDDLTLHSVGVLEVEVLSARHLPKKGGMLSSVDPQVELWTQPQHHCWSSVKSRSRNPKWRDRPLEVLVQEPDSQQLRVVVHDIDSLNFKELLRVNLLRGAAGMLRSANPIGQTAVSLRDICSKPFERQELELRLSGSEWAYELGVVGEDDTATLKLALTYKQFRDLDATSTTPIETRGVLFVDIRQCKDLATADWAAGSSDPYVVLKVANQKQQQTVVVPHSVNPVYNAHFEFFNVQLSNTLVVQVWDRDAFKPDDLLGEVELPVKTIVTWTQAGRRGWRDGWWKLGKHKRGGVAARLLGGSSSSPKERQAGDDAAGAGRIEMKVQFRPYSIGDRAPHMSGKSKG